MTTARKKVIVRRFTPGLLRGYLPPTSFVRQLDGENFLELLDLEGRAQVVSLEDVSMVSFVRDFNITDVSSPEKLLRRTFQARPRTEGLWLRLTLRDGELMEGLAPLDLSFADGLVEDLGVQLIPPDVRGNTQRIYIPRSAITALQIVAVVTTPSKRRVLEMPAAGAGMEAQMALALLDEAR